MLVFAASHWQPIGHYHQPLRSAAISHKIQWSVIRGLIIVKELHRLAAVSALAGIAEGKAWLCTQKDQHTVHSAQKPNKTQERTP